MLYVVLGCEAVIGCVALSYLQRYLLKGLLSYHGWMFDPFGKQSLQTKVWGMAVKAVTSLTRPQLYSYQSSLPTLPVPALNDTCRRVSHCLDLHYLCHTACIVSGECEATHG